MLYNAVYTIINQPHKPDFQIGSQWQDLTLSHEIAHMALCGCVYMCIPTCQLTHHIQFTVSIASEGPDLEPPQKRLRLGEFYTSRIYMQQTCVLESVHSGLD